MSLLDKSLELRQPFCNGYLLKAKLLVSQGQWRTASQCLEQALSIDFQIRDNMDYILTKSILLKQEKKYEEAINVLQNASNSNSELTSSLTKRNKISRYLQLVELYDLLEQSHEASNLLDELDEQFKGTANEGRILMARADSYLKKGSVDESLGVLRTIGTEYGEYFIKSRETMAQIYLKYRKDRRLYASCYRDILEKAPSTQAYLMLGDAYMNILEPERAIEIYEQCLKKNPRDGALTRKVGQALVTTHQFDKAVTYYKAAIKQIGHCSLRYDLAYLLFRMKRFTDSKDVILAAIEKLRHAGLDLTAMDWEAKLLYLLCKVQLVTDSRELAVTTLQETHAIHNKVIRRIPIEQPDLFPEHKKLAVEIGMLLADFLASYQEFERAKHTLKELLLTDAENVKVLGELARLEMITDNFDEAQKYTNSIVKFAPDDNTSVLMLADVMLRKNDMEGAMEQYSQIMEKKPTSFVALARYIEVARRTGKLDSVPALFTKAEEVSPRCINGSEYNFCKGLYQWYMGENVEAMHSFNTARADPLFGTVALINMIEICINPDNQVIGSAAQQANEFDVTFIDQVSSLQDSVVTAQSLLMDLRPRIGNGPDFSILANFILIARSTKVDVDMALGEFSTMLREEKTKNSAGAILGAATAHMLLKQVAKAKNILKRINKLTWNYEEAEYFERSWLLLADIYCQSQKYEPTRQLVEKCIVYNQSCFKAYEYLALIKESESNYREACKNYLISWHLTGESNPTTGYKLAANYMKCKNYVEAIDVARQVLVKYPEYPRIRKEIIEKARIYLKF
ncbi:Tetratricopeptide repeat protein 21B [Halotydeus destructor]|nr:Tetratricopeptide repeat protein 21B [Halotydeus destructor]